MHTAPLNTNKTHRKDEVRCPFCQRRFETQDELTLHIVTRHTQSGVARGPAQSGSGSR